MEPSRSQFETLRPAGGKRSSKRELIVNVFLREERQLSADDVVDLIHREPDGQNISRATVYRTLQWMVEAGIARKVDPDGGRFRFEHSYRHPRHFHLICKSCNQSSEFLSSDIEALVDEIAAARNFSAKQSVVQIYGTCETCRTGRPTVVGPPTTDLLFARDALRIAIATERSGLEFYTRGAEAAKGGRNRAVFLRLAGGEREHLATLEQRYRKLLAGDPQLEARPTFLFFKGAANGLFAAGAVRLTGDVADREALMLAIRCERRSHRFFKRYGESFEDAAGKRVFLDFADQARAHLELLIREYRAFAGRRRRRTTGARRSRIQRATA